MHRNFLLVIPAVSLALSGTQACASKKYVRTRVTELSRKVDSASHSIEATQQLTRQNEDRVRTVQQQVQNATQSAQRASGVAQKASAEAAEAHTKASAASNEVDRLDKASRRLVYETVLDDTEGHFKFGKADLPEDATHKLDELVSQLTQNPRDVYFEIAGYTDSVGSAVYNEQLGLERAEAAQQYLNQHHHIPLHKISVISFGEDNPAASNSTRDGRAKNRRIVIKVIG